MPLRTRIFIVVGILLMLVLGVSIFLYVMSKKSKAPEQVAPADVTQLPAGGQKQSPASGLSTSSTLTVKPATTLQAEQNGVKQLAKLFVERYGTYSTDNNFDNLKDLRSITTESLWQKISSPMRGNKTADSFSGMTTRVIMANISHWEDAAAKVSVGAMRVETSATSTANPKQINYFVSLVKANGEWLVNAVAWK